MAHFEVNIVTLFHCTTARMSLFGKWAVLTSC